MTTTDSDSSVEAIGREDPRVTSRVPLPVDPRRARFPCCVVWSPLPVISWLVPFVGHLGICTEDGVILDFAGSYFISVDAFTFGATSRYVRLNPEQCCLPAPFSTLSTRKIEASHSAREGGQSWDAVLRTAIHTYQHIPYNIFTCNCHCFVGSCLNRLAYEGRDNWNIVDLVLLVLLRGKWVSVSAALYAFAPFTSVLCLGLYMVGWSYVVGWLLLTCLLAGWYLVGTYIFKGLVSIE